MLGKVPLEVTAKFALKSLKIYWKNILHTKEPKSVWTLKVAGFFR